MAKAAEKKEDKKEAKPEKEKGAKGDQLIEKPREPLFSKIGLMILVGSNVVIVVAVVLLVATLSGNDAQEAAAPANAPTLQGDPNQSWMQIENLNSPVAAGSKPMIVRYSLLIGFEGGPAEQSTAIALWTTGSRDQLIRSWADDMIRQYGESEVKDPGFKARFSRELANSLNERMGGTKIRFIIVPSLRYD